MRVYIDLHRLTELSPAPLTSTDWMPSVHAAPPLEPCTLLRAAKEGRADARNWYHVAPPRQTEQARRARVESELGGKDWFHEWRFASGIRKNWWASRRALLDVGGGVTTITRLACVLRPLRTRQIRERRMTLACPNARDRRGFLPLDWLGSDRGHDFWMWARQECVARSGQRARSRCRTIGARRS